MASRNTAYQKKYGITEEDYQRMLAKQGGVCAICNCHQRYQRLAVDHDHKTSVVRGLLCVNCNRGLGRFFDSTLRLRRAAEYLDNAKTRQKGPSDVDKDSQRNVVQEFVGTAHTGVLRCKVVPAIPETGSSYGGVRTGAEETF